MAITTEARKPLYAFVGAGDLAVENIKELPTQVASQFVPKTTALVAELPAKVKGLRGDVEMFATQLTGRAFTAYGDLVERGEKLVGAIRRSPSTKKAEAQVKVAKSQAKAATTSATKAAKATAKAVDSAAGKIG
ncbi:MAG: heparin binding hemagglutinin HbhA [Frankiaceae bacterium]|jgi:hypothetical protein|nr:heparin binding hemagglutinin HbhA [Frankiaceae bacterium]